MCIILHFETWTSSDPGCRPKIFRSMAAGLRAAFPKLRPSVACSDAAATSMRDAGAVSIDPSLRPAAKGLSLSYMEPGGGPFRRWRPAGEARRTPGEPFPSRQVLRIVKTVLHGPILPRYLLQKTSEFERRPFAVCGDRDQRSCRRGADPDLCLPQAYRFSNARRALPATRDESRSQHHSLGVRLNA